MQENTVNERIRDLCVGVLSITLTVALLYIKGTALIALVGAPMWVYDAGVAGVIAYGFASLFGAVLVAALGAIVRERTGL